MDDQLDINGFTKTQALMRDAYDRAGMRLAHIPVYLWKPGECVYFPPLEREYYVMAYGDQIIGGWLEFWILDLDYRLWKHFGWKVDKEKFAKAYEQIKNA